MTQHDRDRHAPTAPTSDNDRGFANALPLVIWTCDRAGRLQSVNDWWTELTGLSEAESLHDKGALVAVHADDREELQRRWLHALTTSSPAELEYRIRTRDGAYRWHLCRVTPIRSESGAITRWVGAALDIHDRRQAEDALRAAERRFEAVFHVNPQAIAVTRLADGAYLNVNAAFVRLTGFSREEVVGKTAVELGIWTPEQRDEIVRPIMNAVTADLDAPYRTKDGRSLTLRISSARIDVDGEPSLVSVATDMSERLSTEATLRRSEAMARARADELAALMDAVPAAVLIARDPACADIRANQAGYELLRIGRDENLSKTAPDDAASAHFKVLSNGVEVSPTDLPLQRAASGVEVRDWEEEIRFADGHASHLYGSAVPLRDLDGSPRGAIAAFVDVTPLKHAEAAMREADRRKDEFLAILSHELRNPLAPILTAARIMEMRGDVATPREREVIVRQALHLVRLVDDLLDVSRVARGKVTLEKKPLELAGVVAKAIESAAPLIESRQHRLHVGVPADGLVVDGDEIRLIQVVGNLLTNAAHYTPERGDIQVTATREGDDVVLRVRDNGVGIDGGLLPQVFGMFVQGSRGADRAQGGLGLGLSLVQTLTTLHGGTVSAFSEGPGRGSEFLVRLPAATASIPPAPLGDGAARPGTVAARAHRVLIVDDYRDGADMIAVLLEGVGYDVRVAYDPSTAMSLAVSFQPQIAILDIGLPVMDGYSLGTELRALVGDGAPVLIALTGYGTEQDRHRSEEAGFAFHIVKPVDLDRLVQILDSLA